MYSEKATKFCEISTLLLTVCTVVRSKVEISQNFVAFSEYMNFKKEEKQRTREGSINFEKPRSWLKHADEADYNRI